MFQSYNLTSREMSHYYWLSMLSFRRGRWNTNNNLRGISHFYLPVLILFSFLTGMTWILLSLKDGTFNPRGAIAIFAYLATLVVIEVLVLAAWRVTRRGSRQDEESQPETSPTNSGNGSVQRVDPQGRRVAFARDSVGLTDV
jgi:hypothetical protein